MELSRQIKDWADQVSTYARLISTHLDQRDGDLTGLFAPELAAPRAKLSEAAFELFNIVQDKGSFLAHLTADCQVIFALRWIYHFRIPYYIPLDGTATYDELAHATGTSKDLLRRVLRLVMTSRFFDEPQCEVVAHSPLSRQMVSDDNFAHWVRYLSTKIVPVAAKQVEATEKWPNGPLLNNTAYSLAFDHCVSFMEFTSQDVRYSVEFASTMKAISSTGFYDTSHLVDSYDWSSIGDGLVVDMGGSSGHVSIAICERFQKPHFIVQDLPGVVCIAKKEFLERQLPQPLGSRIQFQAHTFFEPQSVQGASIYLLRHILHDWPDREVIQILRNLIPALGPKSKILISDVVLPERGSVPATEERIIRATDLVLHSCANSSERAIQEWKAVIAAASQRLRIQRIYKASGSILSILELTLLCYIRMIWNGDHVFALRALHDTYGPVVRLGPSDLSFATTTAFDSIYGPAAYKTFVFSGSRRSLLVPDKTANVMLSQSTAKDVRGWLRRVVISTLNELTGSCAERFLEIALEAGLERYRAGQAGFIDLSALNDDWMWDLGSLVAYGRHDTRSNRIRFDNLVYDTEYFMCLLELCICVLHRFTIQRYQRYFYQLWLVFGRLRGLDTGREEFMHDVAVASGPRPIDAEGSHYARIKAAIKNEGIEETAGIYEELNSLSTHFNIYGTMHSALNCAFSYLLKHPRCLRKLEEELLPAFQSYAEVTDPRLAMLPYLNACITETFRMMPPFNAGILQRVSMGSTVDGIYVPAGTGVQVDQYSLAHSKEHWEAPDEFLPERWLDSSSRKNERACRPFLIGSRQCPAKSLAYQIFRLAIGKMIYLYEIELVNKDFDVNCDGESRLALTNIKLIVEMNPRVPGVPGN
ncbi:hypothetical protein GQX73_g809 [Xylaria multiplex]|uniref:Uncharacterized protein n=1 Tax=Xylaria multiplex TaxID=323545 RepID=A0A7C8NDH7_9PEZI|nr:hypothetical protein GQX73_g809 [Xylaria multiplex]